MARSCSRARDTARWRSWEAVTVAWMVAMAATSEEDLCGGAVDDGARLAHVVLEMAGYGGGLLLRHEGSCVLLWRTHNRGGVGEGPKASNEQGPNLGERSGGRAACSG